MLNKLEYSNININKYKNLINHVAIIMDGNGRWAEKKGKPRNFGYKAGLKAVNIIINTAIKYGLNTLTLYAFSSENWNRSQNEVSFLMDLFLEAFKKNTIKLYNKNIKLNIIGNIEKFNKNLQMYIYKSQKITSHNTGLILNLALNYGGKWDITECIKKILIKIQEGLLTLNEINESLINKYLCISDCPPIDLVIRTGGEKRISNFLLWQIAYSELYFTNVLWPDFNEKEFDKALNNFTKRDRKFGGNSNSKK